MAKAQDEWGDDGYSAFKRSMDSKLERFCKIGDAVEGMEHYEELKEYQKLGWKTVKEDKKMEETEIRANAQLKPVSVTMTVIVNVSDYKAALAKQHGLKPEQVKIVIVEEKQEAKTTKEPTGGDIIGKVTGGEKKPAFLQTYLQSRNFSHMEAAELCGVNVTTIHRACVGQRLREESFDGIVKGLEMSTQEALEFRKSLKHKQRNYHNKERRRERAA